MEDSGEAVYNTLDAMRSFWSTLDEPVDNMLTAYVPSDPTLY